MRLLEVALFLVPFLAFCAWWLLATGRGPSPTVVALAAVALLLLATALIWFGQHQTLAPGEAYIPAHIEDGRIVPGHAGSR
ncbi:MAG: hypothetical protein J2P47_10830 [Acetobacteraceae bacterium]|nr:hypothetical protein [Acetobacteraceae bacterium]